MVKRGPIKSVLGLVGRLFGGRICKGWRAVETKNGKGAVKYYSMLDGTASEACVSRGFMAIYGQTEGKRDLRSTIPMHVLLEVSVENLSRFYTSENAREIYCAYNRFNRIRMDD